MSLPTRPDRPLGAFVAYWRCFSQQAGGRLWLAVALLVISGLLEGYGLLLLVPMLHALGIGSALNVRGANWVLATLNAAHAPLTLSAILAAFVLIKAVQAGVRAFSSTLNVRIDTNFSVFLRERFFRAMAQANWLSLTRQRSSDLGDALLAGLPQVGIATRQLLMLLGAIILAGVQVAVAVALSPLMTAIALAAGTVMMIGIRRFRQQSFRLAQTGQQYRAEMAAAVHEHLASVKITKSHGRETEQFGRFHAAMQSVADHTLHLHRTLARSGIWTEVGAVVAMAIFVDLAITARQVNPAQLLVLAFIFTRLLGQASQLQNFWQSILQALPSFISAEQLRQKLVAFAEPPRPGRIEPLPLVHGMRLENISFQYDPDATAIAVRDIDLTIQARSVTALCGPSGAGKSTLVDLLLGLLSPTTGRVLIDGAPLAGDRLYAWRESIGYVPQETFLFHESVRSNLLWAKPKATETELYSALRAAAAEEFVARLPQGLDTIVGDRGVRLSGGERQRIALARALLRRPTLLVLDEATSSLDTHNERLVQDAIERLHGELTIVLIAHRLSTVRFADRIVVLEHGQIAEAGTWDELCHRDAGVFQRLVAADRK